MKKNLHYLSKWKHPKFLLSQCSLAVLFTLSSTQQSSAAHDFLWARQGKYNFNGYGVALATDAAGNVYSIGNFSGTTDLDPGTGVFNMTAVGKTDAFILKLDKNGNFSWAKQLGGSEEDNAVGIHVDATGNIYVCGIFKSKSIDMDPGTGTSLLIKSGAQDAYVLKLDPSGNFTWGKQFGGGSSECNVYSLATDGSGNVVFGGYFSATADFDPGPAVSDMTCKSTNYEGFICKLSSTGAFAWSRQFEGDDFNGVSNVAADASGNVYATGIFEENMDCDPGAAVKTVTTKGAVDVFVIKLDGAGTFVWSAHAGGTEPDWARGIAVDATGNVFVAGTFDGIANFDPDGAGYILTSIGASWNPDGFVLKLNASGKFSWVKQLGSGSPDQVGGLTLDGTGNIYTTGSFVGLMDFDPGAATHYLTATGSYDMFLSKLDASGNFVWAKNMASATGFDYSNGYSIAVDPDQNVFTNGTFSGSVDFDPGTAKVSMTSSNGAYFIHKVGTKPSVIAEDKRTNEIRVIPNPCQEKCTITSATPLDNGTILIRNLLGQVVQKQVEVSGNTFEVDLSHQATGVYIAELLIPEGRVTLKIVKE